MKRRRSAVGGGGGGSGRFGFVVNKEVGEGGGLDTTYFCDIVK